MSGEPLDLSKSAVRRVLRRLQPRDTFQIIRFSEDSSALGPRPVPATEDNLERGLDYLDDLDGDGGTMMIEGIKAALDFPHEEGHVRIVSFLTDGYIGNEAEILAAVHDHLGSSRIFSFGVGSAPNTYLLDNMAKLGQGAVAYVNGGDLEADQDAVDAFFERIAHPALSDIELDFGGMDVDEVYPSRVPDLWVGRPVAITGRINGPVAAKITVHARVGGQPTTFDLPTGAEQDTSRPAIAQIWARMKIADLAERSLWASGAEELLDRIRGVALDYGLLSKFTAFVAVDSSRVTEGDHGTTVVQPVAVPEGVRYDTTVGQEQQATSE
jgi:Ca-activated chloride channel family protein